MLCNHSWESATLLYFLAPPAGTGNLKVHYNGLFKDKVLASGSLCRSVISSASGAVADVLVKHGDKICFGDRFLRTVATPGHTEVR